MTEQIKQQILAIRKTGICNMFDIRGVFELAVQMDYCELADFIFTNTKAYSHFILTGEDLNEDA